MDSPPPATPGADLVGPAEDPTPGEELPAVAEPEAASKPALEAPPSPPAMPLSAALPDLTAAALVLTGVGWSLASACYSLFRRDAATALLTANILTPDQRARMLLMMVLGAAFLPACAVVYLAIRRSFAAVENIASWSRLLCPLVLAFFLPVFFNWKAFVAHELLLVVSLTGFALLLERLLRVSLREFEARNAGRASSSPSSAARRARLAAAYRRVAPRLPLALTVIAAGLTGGYFAYYTILNHYRLQTSSWDLAIFDNMMWNLLRGHWFKASPDLGRTGSHIQYHATFDAYFFLPLYALRQKADTLLAIQAVFVGAGAIPLYLLAKLKTGSGWIALVLAVAYCLHGPLHGPVFYDFHFLTMAPFFVWWVLYLFERGSKWPLVGMWIFALLLREDLSACMSAAALFFLVSKQRPWWALFGGLLSATYFVVMKFGIMPLHRSAADKETFTWMFKDLVAAGSVGYGGVLKTIFTNPLYAFNAILEPEKISYLLKMFGPVLLLPLRLPKTWIMLVPAALFTLLSSGYKPLYQTFFQYTSNWTPYVFFGAAVVLAEIGRGTEGRLRQRSAAIALAVSCVLFSYHHGSMLQQENFRGGFRKIGFEYTPADKQKYADLVSLAKDIPKTASVAATETEAPHVSNREDCFTMRFGHDNADYLLLSIAEAKTGNTRKFFKEAVDSGKYGFVRQSGAFMLWKRGAPVDRNALGLALIGPEPKPRRKK
jgi:uncharacterized membrane protein